MDYRGAKMIKIIDNKVMKIIEFVIYIIAFYLLYLLIDKDLGQFIVDNVFFMPLFLDKQILRQTDQNNLKHFNFFYFF